MSQNNESMKVIQNHSIELVSSSIGNIIENDSLKNNNKQSIVNDSINIEFKKIRASLCEKNGSDSKDEIAKINANLDLVNNNSTEKNFRDSLLTAAVAAANSRNRSPSPLNDKRMHRVVFTGGPCAGKTTAINRMKSFFENIGWKVLTVPETATFLLGSGVYFYDFDNDSRIKFQENLLKTLIQVEDTINETAKYYTTERHQNCIIIYDRGAMDPVAYLQGDEWEQLKLKNPTWNEIDLRDNRYDQIIHLVTAANGAEQFYTLENNNTRTESIQVAKEIDEKCSKAWIGHPCMDVIDNCTIFEMKITRALQSVCERIGLNLKGFDEGNRKRKFLIKNLPDDIEFPNFQELNVVHNYLVSSCGGQSRIRKSGQMGNWAYSYAIRRSEDGQIVETRTPVDRREYAILSKTIDPKHWTIYQKRRCFIWRYRYYRLDIFEEPCNPSCRGLILLSTRSMDKDLVLPKFIQIDKEVTNDPYYSMFNLSFKDSSSLKAKQ